MQIDSRYFIHYSDQKALNALKAIPGFKAVIKAYMKVFTERQLMLLNMSSRIKLSKEQCPGIYELLPPICEKTRNRRAVFVFGTKSGTQCIYIRRY